MITTRFLADSDYRLYAAWLKSQATDDRHLYFGYAINNDGIDILVDKIIAEQDNHYFLIAEDAAGWIGTLHIAIVGNEVEFGLMVKPECRGRGIASRLMDEALIWVRNRGYRELFMHCLTHNRPIQHLCHKHGLETTSEHGESETKVQLPPPNILTLTKEVNTRQKQLWSLLLRKTWPAVDMYG